MARTDGRIDPMAAQHVVTRAITNRPTGRARKPNMGMEICEVSVHLAVQDYVLMRLRDDVQLGEQIKQEVVQGLAEHIAENLEKYADVSVERRELSPDFDLQHVITVRMGICPVKEL